MLTRTAFRLSPSDDSRDASGWQKIAFYRNSKSCFLFLFVSVVHIWHNQLELGRCAKHRRNLHRSTCVRAVVATTTTSCRSEKWASGKTYRFTDIVSIDNTLLLTHNIRDVCPINFTIDAAKCGGRPKWGRRWREERKKKETMNGNGIIQWMTCSLILYSFDVLWT